MYEGYKANSNSLWLALYFPLLPFAASTTGTPQAATIVCQHNRHQYRVVAANNSAEKGGIHSNMTLSTARTLMPQVHVLDRNLQAEQLAMKQLAIHAIAWSPTVVIQHDQVLLFEIGSCLRLHNGLSTLIKLVHTLFQNKKLSYCMAITPTPASAVLCARSDLNAYVTDRARLISYISNIPVKKIKLTDRQRILLERLGIKHIGDLLRLPRDGFVCRLGLELLRYLDRMTGKQPDPQKIFIPPLHFNASIDFEMEIFNIEQLLPEAKRLLAQLEKYLKQSCAVIHNFEWLLQHENNSCTQVPIQLNHPQQQTTLLIGLSQLALETSFPAWGIVRFTLNAHPLPLLSLESLPLLPPKKQCESDQLLNKLNIRLGPHAVRSICCHTDHKPEKAWITCQPGLQKQLIPSSSGRPLWLFLAPRRLSIHNGRPSFHGSLELTRHERITTNWWNDAPVQRDYYQAQSNRGLIWIFRELKTNDWYIHGIF